MTTKEQLVEQHIREYESRRKHIDELIARADEASKALDENHAIRSELKQYQGEHAEIVEQAEELKKMPLEHWREETIRSAGPMAIWDVIAQKLEDLVERVEK